MVSIQEMVSLSVSLVYVGTKSQTSRPTNLIALVSGIAAIMALILMNSQLNNEVPRTCKASAW